VRFDLEMTKNKVKELEKKIEEPEKRINEMNAALLTLSLSRPYIFIPAQPLTLAISPANPPYIPGQPIGPYIGDPPSWYWYPNVGGPTTTCSSVQSSADLGIIKVIN
jgi:hypothetical protein